jgi:aminomethyltransferase
MALKTPLYDMHIKYGGKIVDFAGYELPVQYSGIIAEHMAVRQHAGMFDVSHMGEILFTGDGALNTLNNLLTNDFTDMFDGQARYSMMLYDNGTIVDDVLVYKFGEGNYMVVVNACNREKDYEWMQSHKLADTSVTDMSDFFAQIALQGPDAEAIMGELIDLSAISSKYYTFGRDIEIEGVKCIVSRTGYTGERGFEIYTNIDDAVKVWERIMATGKVTPCGLGARDTLRLEAAMPLYGHELSDKIMAHETGLDYFIRYKKEFIGREALMLNQPSYKRIGIALTDRGIAREGAKIYSAGEEIGYVSSGTMSPLSGKSIAMARVKTAFSGSELSVDVRGRILNAAVVKTPFHKN